MDSRELKRIIMQKRRSACDDMRSEASKGKTDKFKELKGTIDAYTDVIALIDMMEGKGWENYWTARKA